MVRAALLALLSLAGCAAEPDWSAAAQQALADGRASLAALGAPAASEPPGPREPARIRPLRTAGLPAPPLVARTDGRAAVPNPAGAGTPPSAAEPVPPSTAALGGSGPERLVAMLGEPVLRRAEGPVSIWLYSVAGCQLDVMFYPTPQGPRVGYVQARAGGFAQRTEAACLRDLAAQARRRPAAYLNPQPAAYLNPRPAAYLSPRPAAYLSPRPAAYLSPRPAADQRQGPPDPRHGRLDATDSVG